MRSGLGPRLCPSNKLPGDGEAEVLPMDCTLRSKALSKFPVDII